ncbi:MAG: metallophosphoesterase [Candidatus Jordarchaeum sp.]|uniref:metallophosphoesterase n=1 Tax=Candidatus Jordarchaeum sp. TaxID=2823881 RepID=UPI00404AE769
MNLNVEQLVNKPMNIGELGEKEIREIVSKVTPILEKEPKLVKFDVDKILFVGDTHGDLESTTPIVRRFLKEQYDGVIFLGDYVDRGLMQIENINYLLALKLLHPEKVILLRGNHETPLANRYYGFIDEVASNFSTEFYNVYSKLFSYLPYASLVNGEILCLHGGLAKGLATVKQIEDLPIEVEVSNPILFQLLWNDPREGIKGFTPSDRGDGIFFFGKDVYENFAKNNSIKYLIRAHEVFRNGFHWYFDDSILSLFSAKQYTVPVAAKIAELTPQGDLTVIPV